MSRLFTFGCSFTRYHWPTWADLLSYNYDEYYNYGQPGAGNQFIFEQIVEANVTHQFCPDDTVIVMWSTYQRHDIFKDGAWITPGNIFNSSGVFDQSYIEKYFDIKGSILHSLNFISAIQELLSFKDVQWHMTSMESRFSPLSEFTGAEEFLRTFENKDIFDQFPELSMCKDVMSHDKWLSSSMQELRFQHDYQADEYWFTGYTDSPCDRDFHPTTPMALMWLAHVGFDINTAAIDSLMRRLDMFCPDKKFNYETGLIWCQENIPHVVR